MGGGSDAMKLTSAESPATDSASASYAADRPRASSRANSGRSAPPPPSRHRPPAPQPARYLSWASGCGRGIRASGDNAVVASYSVNPDAVTQAERLIDSRQYVLDSDWGQVQPSTADQNAYLERHSWQEYARWHLGLTDGATDETKARYAFVYGDFRRIHRMGIMGWLYRAAELAAQGDRAGRPRPAAATGQADPVEPAIRPRPIPQRPGFSLYHHRHEPTVGRSRRGVADVQGTRLAPARHRIRHLPGRGGHRRAPRTGRHHRRGRARLPGGDRRGVPAAGDAGQGRARRARRPRRPVPRRDRARGHAVLSGRWPGRRSWLASRSPSG